MTLGVVFSSTLAAQNYLGVLGGVATLSGDARSLLSPSQAFSSYDPKNGPNFSVFAGRHLSDYLTVEGSYFWNRNDLTLDSSINDGTESAYEETRSSTQSGVVGSVLVYFRDRNSRVRPYLSVGAGVVHFSSDLRQVTQIIGSPALPPQHFSANLAALRVPVGIDVKLSKGWVFRYTFSETLTKNPISEQLAPPGQHRLMNFQNLFGLVKQF